MTKESESKDITERQVDDIIAQTEEGGELARPNIISDEALLGVYSEIMDDIRKDSEKVDEILDNFVDMVINEGDSSNSSKEALTTSLKIKTDLADKKIKIADLMTRLKMKDNNTWKPWMGSKSQGTNLTIIDQSGMTKREIIEAAKRKKNDEQKQS